MLRNRFGFIPKRYKKPDGYEKLGRNWIAIYKHPVTGQAHYITMHAHWLSRSDDNASHLTVSRQKTGGRERIGPDCKTIKAAVELLERVFAMPVENNDAGSA